MRTFHPNSNCPFPFERLSEFDKMCARLACEPFPNFGRLINLTSGFDKFSVLFDIQIELRTNANEYIISFSFVY